MYFNVYVCGYNKNKLTVKDWLSEPLDTMYRGHVQQCTEYSTAAAAAVTVGLR